MMTDWTLGSGLAAPMVPEPGSDPSILPWEPTQWRLTYVRAGLSVHALVSRIGQSGDARPWHVHCAGPGPLSVQLTEWHPTAEAARAAVENHIAAHIETEEKS